MRTPIVISIEENDMYMSYGAITAWYNLKNGTVEQRILEFLKDSGISNVDNKRVDKINESNELLLSENAELRRLLEESLELSNRTNEFNKRLKEILLYFWNKGK